MYAGLLSWVTCAGYNYIKCPLLPPSRQTLVSVTTPAVFSLLIITIRGHSDTFTLAPHHFNQAHANNVSWTYK